MRRGRSSRHSATTVHRCATSCKNAASPVATKKPWIWSCGTTFIVFLAGLQNVPQQLYEAMEIDGGGSFHKFVYITLPMISPTTIFCAMVSFVTAIQCFVPSYAITNGGPNNSTMLYFYYMYREAFRFLKMGNA